MRFAGINHLRSALAALAVVSLQWHVSSNVGNGSKMTPLTNLLLNLETLNDRRKLAQDLGGLLVVLELGSDELSKVAKRLRSIQNLRIQISQETTKATTQI